MNLLEPTQYELELLNEIGRWKVIPLKGLYECASQGMAYSPFCRRVKRIEKLGLVRSIKGRRKTKYVTLTEKGSMISQYKSPYLENEVELSHDLTASCLLCELLKYPNFHTGHIVHGGEGLSPEPDALIHASKNDKLYRLALEIELHQKSNKRVREKFARYVATADCDHVLYVMNKPDVFHSYQAITLEMEKKVSQKIILMLATNLFAQQFEYQDARCWFKAKEMGFNEIFA